MTDLASLLRLPGVTPNPGATSDEIAAFEALTGLTLTPELRELYSASNGVSIDRHGLMRINSLEVVAGYDSGFRHWGIPGQWGYFALTDRNDSNPHCVCCDGPAKGYVVRVNHDDSAHIEYRSLGSYLDTLHRLVELPEWPKKGFSYDTKGPLLSRLSQDFYPNTSDRTQEDVATAHRLLAFADTLERGTVERRDAESWAITLFSENEVAEIARFLDVGDWYRREGEALKKLSAMTTPAAQEAIQKYGRESREFTEHVLEALKHGGLTVAESNDRCVRLEPGCVWFDHAEYFEWRREPTVFEEIVRRARELIAYKTQGNA